MDLSNMEKRKFPKTSRVSASVLFRVKGTLGGKDFNISITPTEHNNYISDESANQLLILESNIIEKLDLWNEKQYSISNLQLNIGDCICVSQFTVKSLWNVDDDTNFGCTLDGSTRDIHLNTKTKFMTFSYKKKR
jgi:hypothetical protein